ncbi:hypothetical protein FF1_030544 [Malus domestica]
MGSLVIPQRQSKKNTVTHERDIQHQFPPKMIAGKAGINGPKADNHGPLLNLRHRHRRPRIRPTAASQGPPFPMQSKTIFASPAGEFILAFSSSRCSVSFTF